MAKVAGSNFVQVLTCPKCSGTLWSAVEQDGVIMLVCGGCRGSAEVVCALQDGGAPKLGAVRAGVRKALVVGEKQAGKSSEMGVAGGVENGFDGAEDADFFPRFP